MTMEGRQEAVAPEATLVISAALHSAAGWYHGPVASKQTRLARQQQQHGTVLEHTHTYTIVVNTHTHATATDQQFSDQLCYRCITFNQSISVRYSRCACTFS